MTTPAIERHYVPDGDPCPKAGHGGQPTRLVHIAGIGLFSQCDGCIDAFSAWYAEHTRHVRSGSARAIAGENQLHSPAPAPPQLELGGLEPLAPPLPGAR